MEKFYAHAKSFLMLAPAADVPFPNWLRLRLLAYNIEHAAENEMVLLRLQDGSLEEDGYTTSAEKRAVTVDMLRIRLIALTRNGKIIFGEAAVSLCILMRRRTLLEDIVAELKCLHTVAEASKHKANDIDATIAAVENDDAQYR